MVPAMMRRAPFLLLALLLAGCATFPEVDRAGAPFDDAPPPRLLPTDQVLAAGEGAPIGAEAAQRSLTARADALRRRAEAIRRRPST